MQSLSVNFQLQIVSARVPKVDRSLITSLTSQADNSSRSLPSFAPQSSPCRQKLTVDYKKVIHESKVNKQSKSAALKKVNLFDKFNLASTDSVNQNNVNEEAHLNSKPPLNTLDKKDIVKSDVVSGESKEAAAAIVKEDCSNAVNIKVEEVEHGIPEMPMYEQMEDEVKVEEEQVYKPGVGIVHPKEYVESEVGDVQPKECVEANEPTMSSNKPDPSFDFHDPYNDDTIPLTTSPSRLLYATEKPFQTFEDEQKAEAVVVKTEVEIEDAEVRTDVMVKKEPDYSEYKCVMDTRKTLKSSPSKKFMRTFQRRKKQENVENVDKEAIDKLLEEDLQKQISATPQESDKNAPQRSEKYFKVNDLEMSPKLASDSNQDNSFLRQKSESDSNSSGHEGESKEAKLKRLEEIKNLKAKIFIKQLSLAKSTKKLGVKRRPSTSSSSSVASSQSEASSTSDSDFSINSDETVDSDNEVSADATSPSSDGTPEYSPQKKRKRHKSPNHKHNVTDDQRILQAVKKKSREVKLERDEKYSSSIKFLNSVEEMENFSHSKKHLSKMKARVKSNDIIPHKGRVYSAKKQRILNKQEKRMQKTNNITSFYSRPSKKHMEIPTKYKLEVCFWFL